MASKRKNPKKSKNRSKKRKVSSAKGKTKRVGAKSFQNAKRPARGLKAEPSSGAEGSSLDPKRMAGLRIERSDTRPLKGRAAGDTQSLSANQLDDSESVEELVAEGQDLEGELVQGIENVPAADQGEVRTHASPKPQDQVPTYRNRNRL
jgi:hypothetical protein